MQPITNPLPTENQTEHPTNAEELNKIFDYPAIGELFSDTNPERLENFCARLANARENLERVLRYGDKSEAERASRAIRGIQVTVDFLRNLRQMQSEQKN